MKKYTAIGLIGTLICAPLAACGAPIPHDTLVAEEKSELPPILEEAMPEITVEPTEEPMEEPVEEPVAEPTEEPKEEPSVPASPLPEEKPARAEYVYVLSNGLNIRSGAGTGYRSLGTVEKNVLLKYDGVQDGWYKTYYCGKAAFVSANTNYTTVVSMSESDEKVERVIEEGLRYLGVPYVYGATRLHDGKGNKIKGFSTSKFDCSSLMQYIFYEGAGVLLDMNTRTQIKQGKKVASGDLKRGDLMFFTNASRYYNTGIERVGHVALYLSDNYILHTASDYAKVEQISATRWSYFIEARRVL